MKESQRRNAHVISKFNVVSLIIPEDTGVACLPVLAKTGYLESQMKPQQDWVCVSGILLSGNQDKNMTGLWLCKMTLAWLLHNLASWKTKKGATDKKLYIYI